MSNHVAAVADQDQRIHRGSRLLAKRAGVGATALLLGIGGLVGCGDDDASETVPGQTDEAVESSALAGDVTTTTTPAPSTTARPTTTAPAVAATSEPSAAEATTPPDTEAATDATDMAVTSGAETTAAPEPAVAATAATAATPAGVDSSAPTGSEPAGTAGSSEPTTSAGPTTTGPECEYTESDEFPLERCDAGPAIAAVQSVLQAREYEIGTVDCLFGDQTHYAVRAFQADEELPVDGTVGEETWAALDILDEWGTDTNGNGSIEPNEITLTCA